MGVGNKPAHTIRHTYSESFAHGVFRVFDSFSGKGGNPNVRLGAFGNVLEGVTEGFQRPSLHQ